MTSFTIRPAVSTDDLNAVRRLMREYLSWHHSRYYEYQHLIDEYFDHEGYEREMASLPGPYVPPSGALLVAVDENDVVGCVGLRDLGQGIGEMKRMFVSGRHQTRGIGRALAGQAIKIAKDLGYRKMRLDTGPLQIEAIGMYRSLGFKKIPPYYPLPPELQDMLVFMECDLADALDEPEMTRFTV